jgi:hypothetical protein
MFVEMQKFHTFASRYGGNGKEEEKGKMGLKYWEQTAND